MKNTDGSEIAEWKILEHWNIYNKQGYLLNPMLQLQMTACQKFRRPMKFKWAKLLVFAFYFKWTRLETNDHCSTTWQQLIHKHNRVVKAKVCVSACARHATLSRACLLVGHIPAAAACHALSSFYAGLAAEHQQRAYYVLPRTRLILRDVQLLVVTLIYWYTRAKHQNSL